MEWNNATEMEVRTGNLYQCGSEPPAACVDAPAWTPLQMDPLSSLQPIRHHSGSCFNALPTCGDHLVGKHLQQSSGYQLPEFLATLFSLLNGLVVLGWPIPHCQEHIPHSLGGAGNSSSRLGTWHSAELSPPGWSGSHRMWQSLSGKMDKVWWSLSSPELQGTCTGTRSNKKLGCGRCTSTGSRTVCERNSSCSLDLTAPSKALLFPCSTQRQEEILHPDSHMGWSMKTILSTSRQSCSAELYK